MRVSKGKCVWILEDMDDLRTLLAMILKEKGHHVIEMESMSCAWNCLHNIPKPPDCIISDYNLGDGQSEDWMRKAQETFPAAQIICFTASLNPERRTRLQQYGFHTFEKPTKLSELMNIVDPE